MMENQNSSNRTSKKNTEHKRKNVRVTASMSNQYPAPENGHSIRHVKLSPLASNSDTSKPSFLLFTDESNKAAICRAGNGKVLLSAASSSASSSCAITESLSVASAVTLSASPRAAIWCPFVTSTIAETGDDVLGILTSSLGCPVQLRYFSDPLLLLLGESGQKRNDNLAHDPNWVEASYRFFDNMDYPLCANTIEWHKNRAAHILCGYDKGHVVAFDAERPGRETAWRFQLNNVHASRHKNGFGPQHAVSALALHNEQTNLLAVGTRGTGEIPILDTRMKQPALVLRGGHGDSAAVTQIKFDPLCSTSVFSASRGNALTSRINRQQNTAKSGAAASASWLAGVVQHDMRMPLAPSGLLKRAPCRTSMQPLDFELISPADAERMRLALEHSEDSEVAQSQTRLSQQQQQKQVSVAQEVTISDPSMQVQQNASVIVSGSGRSTMFVGQATPIDDGQEKNDTDWTHITSRCGGGGSSRHSQQSPRMNEQQEAAQQQQPPVTSLAVCVQRGILCLAGGERRFAEEDRRNLLFDDDDDEQENGDASSASAAKTTRQQPLRRARKEGDAGDAASSDDDDEEDRGKLPRYQDVVASKPCLSTTLCRLYRF